MSLSTVRIEKLTWILIYAGLGLLALGLAVQGSDASIGWTLVVSGGVLAVIGVVLIWVRSRMKEGS